MEKYLTIFEFIKDLSPLAIIALGCVSFVLYMFYRKDKQEKCLDSGCMKEIIQRQHTTCEILNTLKSNRIKDTEKLDCVKSELKEINKLLRKFIKISQINLLKGIPKDELREIIQIVNEE